jgi:hypothetical protein
LAALPDRGRLRLAGAGYPVADIDIHLIGSELRLVGRARYRLLFGLATLAPA